MVKPLYYVEFNESDFEVSYTAAKKIALALGGQYLSSIARTSLVPRIPCGFIFRSDRDARRFEESIKSEAEVQR